MFEPKTAAELREHYRAVHARLHPPQPKEPNFPYRVPPKKAKPPKPKVPVPPVEVVEAPPPPPPRQFKLTLDMIVLTSCRVFDVPFSALIGPRRNKHLYLVRHIVAYVAWSLMQTWISSPIIGRKVGGRDHSTIVHSYHEVSKWIDQKEPLIISHLERLMDALLEIEKGRSECQTPAGISASPTETSSPASTPRSP